MKGEQPLIAKPRHLRFEGWKRLIDEGQGSMAVRLFESGATETLDLPVVDVESDRRVVASGSAYRRRLVVERDQQHRRRPAAAPGLPSRLHRTRGGLRVCR